MKPTNVEGVGSHAQAIIRGWVDRGMTFRSGTDVAIDIRDLTVIGGTLTINGDGTAILTIGDTPGDPGDPNDADTLLGIPIQVWSGALSAPPTQGELEAILGSPGDSAGLTFVVHSTTTDYWYSVLSAGALFYVIPATRPLGTITGGGSGDVVTTLSSEGGWSWFQDPRAIAYGTYTYVGYNVGGSLKVAVFNAGALVNTVTLHSALEYDDHDSPTLIVGAASHKLIAFYSAHLGPVVYRRVSTTSLDTDPDLSDGFASETTTTLNEDSADRFFTYPSPVHTSNADGGGQNLVWLFWRTHIGGTDSEWHYSSSTDDGATFPSTTDIHVLTYTKICSDNVSRIDMGVSDGPGQGENEGKIFHAYRSAAAWHKSDGTTISTGGAPMTGADMTTVWDGSGASDLAWISDIALTGTPRPVIAFVRYPAGDQTDHRAMYAAWTGSAWSVHEICVMGHPGGISGTYPPGSPNSTYNAGVVLDHDDPQIVYVARWISGQVEMFRYTTANAGVSFTSEQLTTASTSKNIRPVAVRNPSDLAVVWLYGTYTTYVDYNVAIKGLLS